MANNFISLKCSCSFHSFKGKKLRAYAIAERGSDAFSLWWVDTLPSSTG